MSNIIIKKIALLCLLVSSGPAICMDKNQKEFLRKHYAQNIETGLDVTKFGLGLTGAGYFAKLGTEKAMYKQVADGRPVLKPMKASLIIGGILAGYSWIVLGGSITAIGGLYAANGKFHQYRLKNDVQK